jgi:hypothetical protein
MISDSQVVNGIAHDDCFVHTNRLIMVAVRNRTAGTKVAVFWNCKSGLQRTRQSRQLSTVKPTRTAFNCQERPLNTL